jgi:hypothetical protein
MADVNLTTTAVTSTPLVIGDLRARLRIELRDEDSDSYRWENATLDRHLVRAARELSLVWPREQKTTLTTTASSRELSIASLGDLVTIEAVEYPVGVWPPEYCRFSVYLTTLTLLIDELPVGSEDVAVYWGKLHAVDASNCTLPTVAEDAVVTGAGAYAALEWANYATNRANIGGPDTGRDYRAWGEAQLRRFREMLAEFEKGREGRLRTAGLYRPERIMGRHVVSFDP